MFYRLQNCTVQWVYLITANYHTCHQNTQVLVQLLLTDIVVIFILATNLIKTEKGHHIKFSVMVVIPTALHKFVKVTVFFKKKKNSEQKCIIRWLDHLT